MSNSYLAGENRGGKSKHLNGSASLLVAGAPIEVDHEGAWSLQELMDMNDRFVAAVEQAFAAGLESRASAANDVKLPASPGPRRSTPLSAQVLDSLLQSAMGSATMFVARG